VTSTTPDVGDATPNLLFCAVHTVSALESPVISAAGLQIMMLKPDTPESRLLVDWVEGGEHSCKPSKLLLSLIYIISLLGCLLCVATQQGCSNGYCHLLLTCDLTRCDLFAGVYDALKQKYLKCLLFGISEDEGGSCLMEVLVNLLLSVACAFNTSVLLQPTTDKLMLFCEAACAASNGGLLLLC